EICNHDLAVSPTDSATAANPLAAKDCVSIARFLLALRANVSNGVGTTVSDTEQRLIARVLQQWVGLNTYVSTASLRTQSYQDVLDAAGTPAQTRLGDAVDRMEQNLSVLLDPSVRSQFTSGRALIPVVNTPDYRVVQRPVARWTFNELTNPA